MGCLGENSSVPSWTVAEAQESFRSLLFEHRNEKESAGEITFPDMMHRLTHLSSADQRVFFEALLDLVDQESDGWGAAIWALAAMFSKAWTPNLRVSFNESTLERLRSVAFTTAMPALQDMTLRKGHSLEWSRQVGLALSLIDPELTPQLSRQDA